ncbi:MAG: hypothetical protein GF405_09720 [Candidatus Eisenbacteria bacterium]|nr:hypothetical protein [Candidatus Eisenbacteria bacterium]
MSGRLRGLAALALVAFAAFTSSCDRHVVDGIDLAELVPPERLEAVAEAVERAGRNGPTLAHALSDAPAGDREALAFILSNMPTVDLARVERAFLLETVALAREARERFPWGATVPEDVYLTYVLPPRVSQEPLEPWRPFLYRELSARLEGTTSMREAALEVNRWCGERVGFQPTQRRDQGVFETLASGYGRCEEMMIVHISALRSVCIPARQAWTPYWAASDNNHAWTELWVDGAWHYTGACEPRDELDDAWFSGPAGEAALVLSAVFGEPAAGEDVYRREERFALVNSTERYGPTGVLRVSCERAGGPVSDERIAVSLWNFGALRAIAGPRTDEDGTAEIALGDGRYVVSAGDSLGHDWKLVSVTAGDTTDAALEFTERRPFEGVFRLVHAPGGGEDE